MVNEGESLISLPPSWNILARLAWLARSLPNLLPNLNRVRSYLLGWERLLVGEYEGAGVCGCSGEVVRETPLGRGVGCLLVPRASGAGGGWHG